MIHERVRPSRTVVLVAGLWTSGYVLATVLATGSALQFLTNIVYIGPDTAVAGAAVLVARRWRRVRPRSSAAWAWVAVSFATAVLGDLVYAGYYYLAGQANVYPSWADPLWVVADLALIPAIVLTFPAVSRVGRWRAALDASVAALGLGTVLWWLLVNPEWAGHWSLAAGVTVTYPLIDLIWLVVLISVGFSGHRRNPRSIQLVTAGAAVYGVTDISAAYLTNLHSYVDGKWLDIGWQVAGALFFLAAATAIREATAPNDQTERQPDPTVTVEDRQAVSLLPVLAGVTAVLVVVTYEAVSGQVDDGTLLMAASAVVAMTARLVLSIQDQRRVMGQLTVALAEQRRLATTDDLTHLPNRRHLSEELETAILRTQSGGVGVAVLMVDLDHFKRINDRRGHSVGDDVLRQISVRLSSLIRSSDVVGRWGGEEFLCLLPGTELREAEAVAERVRSGLAATPIEIPGDRPIWITASIGTAATGPGAATVRALLQLADDALYNAKAGGRNRVHLALSRAD